MASKLKNKQGATILMALLFLLVAMMVSCVIISAAVTALKTLDQDRAQQQAYLDVSSAARWLAGDMDGTQFTLGYIEQYKKSADGVIIDGMEAGATYVRIEDLSQKQLPNAENSNLVKLWEKIAAVYESTDTKELEYPEFTIQAPNMGPVKVELWVKEDTGNDEDITARIYNDSCSMILTMKITVADHVQVTPVATADGEKATRDNYYVYTCTFVKIDKEDAT